MTQKSRSCPPLRGLVLSVSLLVLSACATNPALERSRAAFADGDRTAAFILLKGEVAKDPGNHELRAYYLRQRELLASERLAAADRARAAGRTEEAARLYAEVLQIDSESPRARIGAAELAADARRTARLNEAEAAIGKDDAAAERAVRAVLVEQPSNARARQLLRTLDERADAKAAPVVEALGGAMAKPVTLEFREAPLRIVFEALARASGLNFVFDRDVRADSKVTLFVRNSSVDEVLKLITTTQQLERKLLNTNSVLIYPANAAKQKEYLDLVTRSFYLANADAKQALAMVRQLVKTKDVFIDEKLNMLAIKDTPEAVRLAERVLATLDIAEPEVMLEVEVLEIGRNKLSDLGVEFPNEVGYGLIQSGLATTTIVNGVTQTTTSPGGALAAGVVNLRNTGSMVPYVSNPAAILKLRNEDGDTSLLANPRIRVKNREKAKIHIGEKLPVFTTTSTANVGVSASVSYLDVGLKLDVEPSVTLEDEVVIKVALEVSSIVKEVPGPSSSLAYQIGTRSAATTLRLADGETQVLAGLISDEERSSARRLPGLGDIPGLGRLFSAQRDSAVKTEVVLLITPRIVRNVIAPPTTRADQPAGTESSVGKRQLRLGPTAPNSLGLHGGARTPPGAGNREPVREAPVQEEAPAAEAAPAPEAAPAQEAAPAGTREGAAEVTPVAPAAPGAAAAEPAAAPPAGDGTPPPERVERSD
ncbi:secretin N-terminal domain-containing protein [Thauera sinica]|uniref:Secretin N-terminal domain-containing protein n=1 Tax=Thauera sinica TaxID=2665146 RepID=A0ABW1ANP4_9RHOO|nr:secretin N-terminal domain-containing protein [Thauera sp. K11]ATE60491.1 general secretion pathway protein GspD [Thauera sp. K11]